MSWGKRAFLDGLLIDFNKSFAFVGSASRADPVRHGCRLAIGAGAGLGSR